MVVYFKTSKKIDLCLDHSTASFIVNLQISMHFFFKACLMNAEVFYLDFLLIAHKTLSNSPLILNFTCKCKNQFFEQFFMFWIFVVCNFWGFLEQLLKCLFRPVFLDVMFSA